MSESFQQKNRLVTCRLFDLCLFKHFSPVANFGQQSLQSLHDMKLDGSNLRNFIMTSKSSGSTSKKYSPFSVLVKVSSITGSVNILAKAESGYLVNVSIFVLNILPPTSNETSCSFLGEDMYNGEKLSFSGVAFSFSLGSSLS